MSVCGSASHRTWDVSPHKVVRSYSCVSQADPEAPSAWLFTHSQWLPYWDQPVPWSSSPLLGSSSLDAVSDIEMCNDYTNNTWISPYCKNSNTADKMKAFLASSASRHATVLPCSD